ncbi:unnamed protein product [Adineta steineri]|uniref:Uncharacterized protein n=4 Tax=Adineta steineri TaxID=433720 RepID=A0A814N1B6_9BILA|nr:unnamed protein product [Adineta steineri]CAF4184635.1 unnamed protein product [Adineta steineri]
MVNVVIGLVTELTGEKRGEVKYFRRFQLIKPDEEIISGWVFSTMSIEETMSGKILLSAEKNKSAVRLEGTLTKDEANRQTIKVSINSKDDKCIDWAESEVVQSDYIIRTTTIYDALLSNTPSRLEAVVLDENEEISFNENEKPCRYKMFIIGDSSGTTPLLVHNGLIDSLKMSETFIFNQIKREEIHDKMILSTSPNSTISHTTNIINPNLHNMEESMLFNQIDIQQINTCFEEIPNLQKEMICPSCKINLIPMAGKGHLLKCGNCSKMTWCKSNDFNGSVVLRIDNQASSFFTVKNILQNFFQQQNSNVPMTSENLSKYYLLNGPWKITLSHFHRLVLGIHKI